MLVFFGDKQLLREKKCSGFISKWLIFSFPCHKRKGSFSLIFTLRMWEGSWGKNSQSVRFPLKLGTLEFSSLRSTQTQETEIRCF